MPGDGCEALRNPGLFGTVVLWLKADMGVDADGSGRVRQWNDQSGRGNNVAQGAPTAQPQVRTAEIAGHPAVVFDGQDDVLVLTSASINFSQGFSLFAAIKPTASSSDAVFLNIDISECFGGPAVGALNGMDFYLWRNNRIVGAGAVTVGLQQVFGATLLPSGHVTFWRNGYNVTSGDVCYLPGTALGTKIAVGASTASPPSHFSAAAIGEMIVFSSALSPSDSIALSRYLQARWGIPL